MPGRNTLLNPAISGLYKVPFPPMRDKIISIVNDRIAAGDAEHVSIYFQALPTGYWFGLNEREEFAPASLLKVHVMIAVLKQAETDPGLLKRKIKIRDLEKELSGSPHASNSFRPASRIETGKDYSVEELLQRMIVFSDNNASYNLQAALPEGVFLETLAAFGVPVPEVEGEETSITVKQYMMTILSLYNATYLRPAMAQKALSYMLESGFDSGLAAGLPGGTKLANKFGERGLLKNGKRTNQLHDCGIVYLDKFPYLVGVMTRGQDTKKLEAIIAEISALLYKEVADRLEDKL
jgi:beta-lactamase class A